MKKSKIMITLMVVLAITLTNPLIAMANNYKQSGITLTVSAAASLKDVLTEVNKYFESQNSGIKVSVNYGGSGTLEKQIEAGAPVDVFISADTKNVKKLNDKNLVDKNSIQDIAKNKLVLVTYANNSFRIKNIQDLAKSNVENFSIGALGAVPAGDYAKETLTYYNLWDKVNSKIVYAKDVTGVLSYVKTGNVMAGFVYFTDAKKKSDAIIKQIIPDESHSPIVYEEAIIAATQNKEASKLYADYLMGTKAQVVFKKFGFATKLN